MTARLRRSELSTPGTSEKMMAKAAASDADLVFLDLEDSVAPAEKKTARTLIASALTTHDWGMKTEPSASTAFTLGGPTATSSTSSPPPGTCLMS